jgi:hypothetical protein
MAEMPLATNDTTREQLVTVSQALQVAADAVQRAGLIRAGVTFGDKRDLYETLGYKRNLRFEDYKERYARGGIAARIIDAFPDATWRIPPVIRDKAKPDETVATAFEQAWATIATRLHVWQTLAQVDRLASLGHYAVLVLGLRSGTSQQVDWGAPATPVMGERGVVYLKAYSEEHASLMALVSDDESPLFGRPSRYAIDFSRHVANAMVFDPLLRPTLGDRYGNQVEVHASRVLHIAENGLEDTIIGTPRLRAVWNYLDDLDKESGAVAEMTWTDALRRFVLSLDPDASMDKGQAEKLSDEAEEFVHQWRRFMRVQGMQVTQLQGTIPDASNNIEVRLELIAGTVHMPKRMLVGSERGELASSQDENNWATTIMERQQQYAEPLVLRPFIDRLIDLGALPFPRGGYVVEWPNLLAATEKDRAETALHWSRAIATYAGPLGSPQDVLPLEIYLEDILEWPKEQVQRILQLLGDALAQDGAGAGGEANVV